MTIALAGQVPELRRLYAADDAVRFVLDHFANRDRNQNTSTVRRVEQNLLRDGKAISRADIVRAFKSLETAGCGTFKAGRWQHESRFEWQIPSKSAGQAAAGEINDLDGEVPPPEIDDRDDELTEHSYWLRPPALQVKFSLPNDLTSIEADRLARFIRTLPSQGGGRPLLPDEDFSDWEKR
jgi:hypothetical protein